MYTAKVCMFPPECARQTEKHFQFGDPFNDDHIQEAVIRFQAVNGLSADGLAGAKTQELLYSGNALSADQAPKPDFLILVNHQHKLGKNDAPTDLVTIENVLSANIVKVKYSGTKADRTATEALGQMLSAAIADGVSNFQISSAYRTYS